MSYPDKYQSIKKILQDKLDCGIIDAIGIAVMNAGGTVRINPNEPVNYQDLQLHVEPDGTLVLSVAPKD